MEHPIDGIDPGPCLQPLVVLRTQPHFRPPREITQDQFRETVRQHADGTRRWIRVGAGVHKEPSQVALAISSASAITAPKDRPTSLFSSK